MCMSTTEMQLRALAKINRDLTKVVQDRNVQVPALKKASEAAKKESEAAKEDFEVVAPLSTEEVFQARLSNATVIASDAENEGVVSSITYYFQGALNRAASGLGYLSSAATSTASAASDVASSIKKSIVG